MSNPVDIPQKEEAKKRGRKPKKQPSPEEVKAMLEKSRDELKLVLADLEVEAERLKPLNLKRMPELVTSTINNLKEDLAELDDHIKELSNSAPSK